MNNVSSPATKQDLADLKEELLEAMHDIETHLLKGFYGYTESTQKHLNELDRSDGSLRERLGTLENRVIDIEKRLNFPPSNP